MKIPSLLLVLCTIVASQQVAGRETGGIDVPDTISLPGNSETLVLNGAGIRKKFFMTVYVGALYLPAKSTDEQAITSDTGPASVDMYIVHSEISKEKIVGGWEDGLQANLDRKELETLRPRLDQFNAMFKAVREGDVIRIGYLPDTGTEVRINGEWRGVVPGNDFFRALLKTWLGSSPVSKSLKKDMLGLD
jgi:hypothetical protein